MARVIVDVMLKPEILDPQGKAVHAALNRLGLSNVEQVRQGKHFEIDFNGPIDQQRLETLAAELLSNPVIEDFTLRVVNEK